MIELIPKERIKIAVKRMLSNVFDLAGGFRMARLISSPCIIIIAYHRIISHDENAINSYISVDITKLGKQIEFFKKYFTVISLEEAIRLFKTNTIDKQYLVMTFDDGYKDNYSLGLDTFIEHKVQPAIFVTTDCIENQTMLWPDVVRNIIYNAKITTEVLLDVPGITVRGSSRSKISGFKIIANFMKTLNNDDRNSYIDKLEILFGKRSPNDRLMLNWDEISTLHENGISIGSHTVCHPVLSALSEEAVITELTASKEVIEKELGIPVRFFAYPNGTCHDFNDQIVSHVKSAGYEAAVTTIRGVNKDNCDLFRLRRTGIYLTDSIPVIKAKIVYESFFCGGTSRNEPRS